MFSFFKYILCEDKLTCTVLLIRTVMVLLIRTVMVFFFLDMCVRRDPNWIKLDLNFFHHNLTT